MGICEKNDKNSNFYNKVKIDGKIKDLSTDYLIKESIKMPVESKYKFTNSKLGRGSFGEILLGLDKFNQVYAIKIINKEKIIKGQLLANEVRIGTKVNHRNVLGIKEVYEDKKTISLVMDYCEGGDLFDFITKNPNGKLEDKTSIDLIIQILSAINYLHNELNIVHRDIKPENFLITMKEQHRPIVKLIDFGFATFINKSTKIKGNSGTSMYMAPEIYEKHPYDEKVDIWSTGIILYNMLTGYSPFNNGDENYKKYQILNKEIDFELITNNDLRELCKEMMERNPEKRIDAKTALEKALEIYRNINNEQFNLKN